MIKLFRNSKKLITFLLVISITLVTLSGCAAKNNSSKTANNNSNTANKTNSAQMKQRMEDNIKPLVTDGTITQSQADQIINTLTANNKGFGQRNGNNSNRSNTNKNSNTNNNNSNENNKKSYQGNNNQDIQGQNTQRPNPLSKLVSDGVITQAQADAVMQKIYGNFQRHQNSNTNQDSGNNENSQSTSSNS